MINKPNMTIIPNKHSMHIMPIMPNMPIMPK